MSELKDKIDAIITRLETTSSDPKWLNDDMAEIKALAESASAQTTADPVSSPQLNDALVETMFQSLQDMEPADARALPSVINKNMKFAVYLSRLMTQIAQAGVTSFNISRKIVNTEESTETEEPNAEEIPDTSDAE